MCGVGEVELRLGERALGGLHVRCRPIPLGGQNGDLPFGRRGRRRVALFGRDRLLELRRGLLLLLDRAGATVREISITGGVRLREGQRRIVGMHGCTGLIDDRLLAHKLAGQNLDVRLRARQFGLGVGNRRAVVAVVDVREFLAGANTLVVVDIHGSIRPDTFGATIEKSAVM